MANQSAPGPTKGPASSKDQRKTRRAKIHRQRAAMIKPGSAKSEINVTPLVDVVLVLLIIFMVVTPLLHRGVAVELPRTAHHVKKQDTGEQLVVSVRKDGTYIDADKIDGDSLSARVQQELKNGGRPVFVRADRSLRYGEVRKVIEQIHAGGASTVEMQTEELSKE